ncbi:alpha/beta hydrolase, partial [Streptomyces sp. t39]|uniref:alpha/beta hydrolase n=1 Tax=Streptomyces sp. t39 TaxID=1828156 RepID=UPI0011CD98B5
MAEEISFSVTTGRGSGPLTLGYERRGGGEPLLLLHGIGHHWQAWQPVLEILAAERDVIAVDLPGFGSSRPLPDGLPYDLPTIAAALDTFCREIGVERPHVAGNSLGGLLALELGRQELVRSVTALSPAGFWSERERVYAFTTLRAMRLAARSMPQPVIERLSRTTAGRAVLVSSIYARPGRRSPAA